MRWSGTIRPGTVYNDMCSHYDLMPTFGSQAQLMITGDHRPWPRQLREPMRIAPAL